MLLHLGYNSMEFSNKYIIHLFKQQYKRKSDCCYKEETGLNVSILPLSSY